MSSQRDRGMDTPASPAANENKLKQEAQPKFPKMNFLKVSRKIPLIFTLGNGVVETGGGPEVNPRPCAYKEHALPLSQRAV